MGDFYDEAAGTYPTTERDNWLCDCGRTYADASQELEHDTSCVYCGSDNWKSPVLKQPELRGSR